jgi:hypothetical protein
MINSVWKRALTPISNLVLDLGIWESSFSFSSIRSSRRTTKIEWWSPKQAESWSTIRFNKLLCHPRMKGKVSWVTDESSSLQTSSCPSCYAVNASFIISCAPPSKILERDFLRGRVVTPRIMETLIKSLNLQLCHKVRANQVIKVWNQKSEIKEFKFEVKSSPKRDLFLITCSTSFQIYKNYATLFMACKRLSCTWTARRKHTRGIHGLVWKAYMSCVSGFPCRVYIDSNRHDTQIWVTAYSWQSSRS